MGCFSPPDEQEERSGNHDNQDWKQSTSSSISHKRGSYIVLISLAVASVKYVLEMTSLSTLTFFFSIP